MSTDTDNTLHLNRVQAIGEANGEKAPLTTESTEPQDADQAAPVDETEEVTDDSAASDGTDAPAAPKKKGVHERINELTREKYEERRARQEAEDRLVYLEQQFRTSQQPQAPAGKPTLESCGYDQDLLESSLISWAESQAQSRWQHQFQQQQAQQLQQERASKAAERIQALEQEVPGAWEAATTAPINYTPTMLEAIAESEMGPKIGYFLSQNLDEAHRISRLSPFQQAIAMGRVEAQLSTQTPSRAAPKTVTKAPPPPPVSQSGAKVKTPLGEQTIEDRQRAIRDYEASRNR